ncbi:MAG TPA: ScbA/BarX family gamma-butyrolactone biosynthesis protein [Streptomyces sp.]|nr:ScbA/BarX family gamma-butyrolactone biosynthesis protein [Streptomyces sp.]
MTFTPSEHHLPESKAYSSPVPREFVHKAAHAEVLLTGWRQCGESEFEVGAQWPRDHGFWRTDSEGVQDPMLLVETTRQALPMISHAAYGVPRDHALIWDHHHCAFAAPLVEVTERPAEVLLQLSASQAPADTGRLRNLSLKMTISSQGRPLGTARTVFSALSPEVYTRLRGPRFALPSEAMAAALDPPAPVEPALVGRESRREVVLAPTGDKGRWQLRVLTSSPWLFDHPVDHLPGMLLMEAARQCGRLSAPGRQLHLVRLDAEFERYVELDAPSWIEAERVSAPVGEHHVKVSVTQHGQQAFTAVVGFAGEACLDT